MLCYYHILHVGYSPRFSTDLYFNTFLRCQTIPYSAPKLSFLKSWFFKLRVNSLNLPWPDLTMAPVTVYLLSGSTSWSFQCEFLLSLNPYQHDVLILLFIVLKQFSWIHLVCHLRWCPKILEIYKTQFSCYILQYFMYLGFIALS